jgi:hypothetical protein
LPCSRRQFIRLIEELLCFHAWYKYGPPPVTESTTNEEIDELQTSIRQLIARIQVYCPRHDGSGWRLQKLHELLHLVFFLRQYRHASNIDAGRGERLLKDFLRTPQQRANSGVWASSCSSLRKECLKRS